MRIHGVQLRGLPAPAGDHQLRLDPAYSVLCSPDLASGRALLALLRALLYPHTAADQLSAKRGRAAVSLALRADAYLLAADFERGKFSLAKHDPKSGGYAPLTTSPREIEDYMMAVGLPAAAEFFALHGLGFDAAAASANASAGPVTPATTARAPAPKPDPRVREAERDAELAAAREAWERECARLGAEHAAQIRERAKERRFLEGELEAALAAQKSERERAGVRLDSLRAAESSLVALEREHKETLAELEKHAVLAETTEDFETRIAQFRALSEDYAADRARIEETRRELLGERVRLRAAPRRQIFPLVLGSALGVAGSAAGLLGYALGQVLAAAGLVVLIGALWITRGKRSELGRAEALLAALRVRERAAERRFESEGATVRMLLVALGTESIDELVAASQRFREQLDKAEEQRLRLEHLRERAPDGARDELGELQGRIGSGEDGAAVRAAREALARVAGDPPPPTLPAEPHFSDMDTAVELRTEDPPTSPTPTSPTPTPPSTPSTPSTLPGGIAAIGAATIESLFAAGARALGRNESEMRARVSPLLPVYLRALSQGSLTHARQSDAHGLLVRGAKRDEQPLESLPPVEREIVRVSLQLALVEALASDRRAPLLIGPDLELRDPAGQRALGRALRRLASLVQVIHVTGDDTPFREAASLCTTLAKA